MSIEQQLQSHIADDTKEHGEYALAIQALQENNERQNQVLEKMSNKVDEMHKVFTSANWIVGFTLKTFALVGTITGALIGLFELWKRIK